LEVTDEETKMCEVKQEESEGKQEGRLQSEKMGGRQENSLGTIRYNSQVLYTNTGWSVRSTLG
jgi:hypothetical protein